MRLPNVLLAIQRNVFSAIALPLVLGTLNAYSINGDDKWYEKLHKPPFGEPPEWLFGVAWTIIYICMGYAAHLAVKEYDTHHESSEVSIYADLEHALALYHAQLIFNLAWLQIYFRFRMAGLSLCDIIILFGLVWYMANVMDRATGQKTTIFLIPYCLWISYATYLNAGLWWLNLGSKNL